MFLVLKIANNNFVLAVFVRQSLLIWKTIQLEFIEKQAEKLKSRKMKEGWMKNDIGWVKNDEGWWRMMKDEEGWRMNNEG